MAAANEITAKHKNPKVQGTLLPQRAHWFSVLCHHWLLLWRTFQRRDRQWHGKQDAITGSKSSHILAPENCNWQILLYMNLRTGVRFNSVFHNGNFCLGNCNPFLKGELGYSSRRCWLLRTTNIYSRVHELHNHNGFCVTVTENKFCRI